MCHEWHRMVTVVKVVKVCGRWLSPVAPRMNCDAGMERGKNKRTAARSLVFLFGGAGTSWQREKKMYMHHLTSGKLPR